MSAEPLDAPGAAPPAGPARPRGRTAASGLIAFLRHPANAISAAVLALIVAAALAAPLVAPYPFDAIALDKQLQPPSWQHWMGTDQYGRDVLSRAIYGARVSLLVGFAAVGLAVVVGVTLGSVAAYAGGLFDEAIMRVVEVFMSVPGVVLALAIVGILGPSLPNLIIALSVYRITQFARVSRGAVLSVKGRDYIHACDALGYGRARVLMLHILPNCVGPIVVLATVLFGNAILTEATVSFLGVGIQPPAASWGVMIADGNEYLLIAWWISVLPGLCLLCTMIAINLLGDGLRDFFDPRGAVAL